ncbi:MAG: hypothetical protein K2P46_04690 [Alistipes sp.]|nr:hypothetical protein [Alistipes sp.]
MKQAGHRLKEGVARGMAAVGSRLVRARHFRGHGVHSPFVYALVREVFMRNGLLPGDRALYDALRGAGVAERRAVQLQNLAIHAGYATFGLNRADGALVVALPGLPQEELLKLAEEAKRTGATLAIMTPCAKNDRTALCRALVAQHDSTSVDNRAYLLLFNNGLPKQHFVL